MTSENLEACYVVRLKEGREKPPDRRGLALDQSAEVEVDGCCFIISSIPFFISFAEGSALWVATIQL